MSIAITFSVGQAVVHRNCRYIGHVTQIGDGPWFGGKVLIKWNLGFSDWYPVDWLEPL
jgi:hypothetical protein